MVPRPSPARETTVTSHDGPLAVIVHDGATTLRLRCRGWRAGPGSPPAGVALCTTWPCLEPHDSHTTRATDHVDVRPYAVSRTALDCSAVAISNPVHSPRTPARRIFYLPRVNPLRAIIHANMAWVASCPRCSRCACHASEPQFGDLGHPSLGPLAILNLLAGGVPPTNPV